MGSIPGYGLINVAVALNDTGPLPYILDRWQLLSRRRGSRFNLDGPHEGVQGRLPKRPIRLDKKPCI